MYYTTASFVLLEVTSIFAGNLTYMLTYLPVFALYSPSGGHAVRHGAVESIDHIGKLSYAAVQIYKQRVGGSVFRARFSSKAGSLQLNTYAHIPARALMWSLPRGLDRVDPDSVTVRAADYHIFQRLLPYQGSIQLAVKSMNASGVKANMDIDEVDEDEG
jgi:hypothetical protein